VSKNWAFLGLVVCECVTNCEGSQPSCNLQVHHFPSTVDIEFDLQGEKRNDAVGQLVQDFKHGVVSALDTPTMCQWVVKVFRMWINHRVCDC